ncbi:MAG: alkaline phosphatase family protein [Candidatus Krumholzibacteriia bacterium]
MDRCSAWPRIAALVCLGSVIGAAPAQAYIGPGAGFALGGSLLFGLIGVLLAMFGVLTWPLRFLIRQWRRRGIRSRARTRRVVVLGLDGLDAQLCREFLAADELPHLRELADEGCFGELATTLPAVSPVAWSTFATGVDPGGHGIFDFLRRDPRTCQPELSSTRLLPARPRRRGPFRWGWKPARMQSRRRSRSFWSLLGEHGVETTVLRVPLTFPPERFRGRLLSAMCLPDLRGTQGTFTHFTAADGDDGDARADDLTGGERRRLERAADGAWAGSLPGPEAAGGGEALAIPVRCRVDAPARRARIEIGQCRLTLGPDVYSPWLRLTFGGGRRAVHGVVRLRVTAWEPFGLYVTPINIDPQRPAMPISQPPYFATMLSRLHGPYATLGMAEDTWALNERVLDEDAFLEQVWSIHAERQQQWLHTLDRQREGVAVCVFDATDRVQHTFLRYHDSGSAAADAGDHGRHAGVIADLYRRADDLVGRTRAAMNDDEVLLVISDHGFKPFRRAVDLNAWFRREGYLYLEGDPTDGPLPALPPGQPAPVTRIDWARTRAYASGLAGFYLNLQGREFAGCVAPAAAADLRRELMDRLRGLPDPAGGIAISELWASAEAYRGPYRDEAPDVIVGYNAGWRADWDTAVGAVTGQVFRDNDRPWSADHCIDPRQVPGVLFSNRRLRTDGAGLVDLAPTILDCCGVPVPAHMHGRSLSEDEHP